MKLKVSLQEVRKCCLHFRVEEESCVTVWMTVPFVCTVQKEKNSVHVAVSFLKRMMTVGETLFKS